MSASNINLPPLSLAEQLEKARIEFPRDKELDEQLTWLTSRLFNRRDLQKPYGHNNRAPQHALVVSGATGAGKTTTLERAIREREPTLIDPDGNCLKVLSAPLPSPFSAKEFARQLLNMMGTTTTGKLNEPQMWEMVSHHLRENRIGLVHFDEIQRFTTVKTIGRADRSVAADRFSATINELISHPAWPVALVVSGTEETVPLWNSKNMDQVRRRSRFVIFEQMTPHYYPALEASLRHYATKANLAFDINVNDLGQRISLAGEKTVGMALEICREAVLLAAQEQAPAVTLKQLGRVYAARNGSPADENPFYVAYVGKLDLREKRDIAELDQAR
ncbi:ATP-binding protein [Devosia sp. Leaf64]|uniref:ATP-binding protein n=1 Tax=Devosia sp. Leaf64 TaxID=1736229 RepID=UPI000713760D|nr:ATP-binding protein [Devosia sp. Leaf64]KQN77507.1 hypothetical protein ASE94_16010 [Devosia sp. Leaf64]